MEARDTLIAFLHEQKSAGQSVVEEDSVEALVESNFDLIDDGVTRKLIDRALAERDTRLAQKGSDSELLGSWGVIIDAIKEVTLVRRDRAGELLQLIVSTGMQKGPKELEALVYALRDKGQVDRLLIDLVSTSAQQCKQQGNALADILLYCQAFLEKTKDLKSARVTSPPTLAKAGAGSGSTASSPAPASTSAPASTPASSSASASASTPASSSASVASEDEEEEEEEEEEDEEEQAKVAAGTLLRELLKDAAGDASALRMKLQQYVLTGEIGAPFVSVLEDNVAACRAAQYVNKLKVQWVM
ncbi:hypothetical protein B484DRAFT_418094 [Ochromonadaceae sp. CCMP2298]|nr:hypothetical protein B484DRAFT_418094 [Ochromonadaceae sp. CCMP2298]